MKNQLTAIAIAAFSFILASASFAGGSNSPQVGSPKLQHGATKVHVIEMGFSADVKSWGENSVKAVANVPANYNGGTLSQSDTFVQVDQVRTVTDNPNCTDCADNMTKAQMGALNIQSSYVQSTIKGATKNKNSPIMFSSGGNAHSQVKGQLTSYSAAGKAGSQ